ncbi:GRB10-interacting GYF protein 1 isoform X1 [Alosa pseudoharengus]|uniref:GRB10-interacting GYF protein 1 isoform X1 n=1 Tax=Alosa pseudoharengus TaxID=34774 RepID=UPI003F8A5FEE
MTAESLNFGPEWLRALSRGGSVTSPPPSPAMPKSKLADYRYGREEMLALYIKDNKVPEQLQDKEFAPVLQEQPLQPLALVPLTEEEQVERNFSMSVNSSAVLRLMGKGGGAAPVGVARGRGTVRGGRGRGRGEGGFYQRGPEEGEVGFGRSREMHRSQSWDDRGERRFEKPLRRDGVRVGFEEGAAGARKDFSRSDSDNWRTLREEEEDAAAAAAAAAAEPGGSWRTVGGRRDDGGPRSAGWRDHVKKFDFPDGGRRRTGSDGMDDDRDLPEWCTDEEDGEMGTFDSSGAFMCIKKSSRDPIPEDQELEFEALEDERGQERRESAGEGGEEAATSAAASVYQPFFNEREMLTVTEVEMMMPGPSSSSSSSSPPAMPAPPPSLTRLPPTNPEHAPPASAPPINSTREPAEDVVPPGGSGQPSTGSSQSVSSPPALAAAGADLPPAGGDNEEEERMKHLQQEAEKMVASLQDTSLEEERFTQALQESHGVGSSAGSGAGPTHGHSHTHQAAAAAAAASSTHPHGHSHSASSHSLAHPASALPLSHEAAMKWFYKDPQGEIQGPFSTVEMCEWFQAGYFTMTLLVKRGCDEGFQPLGDVIKMWGRVPFSPGPSPPPLLSNMDQEVFKKQLEQVATAALYQQQLQMRYQHINSNRCGESSMMPAMNRSMSVPDSGSLWDMHTSASQQSAGGEASLWDLTMGNLPQGLTLEQLQQKLQQERREAELRVKREEEERKRREEKRRQQEEQKRREEEELFHRKQQCRQQQELIMKLLQQSQQQQQQQQQPVGGGGAQSQGPCWNSAQSNPLAKPPKTPLNLLEMEAERLLKQQHRVQQQQPRDRQSHGGLTMGQWGDGGVGGMWGAGSLEGKASGGGSSGGGNSGGMGLWDEAVKNQSSHRSMSLKNSHSSPSLSEQYMLRRKHTEDEEKLLRLLQGMKPQPQDGFTTWSEQMLHALNTSANNSSSSQEVATIVAYLKEVESPYEVHDFIRAYLGDTVEAKEFAKQFLERRAKQKANQQRQQQQQQQQQQLSKELSGLNMNFPLQSMFQASHSGKGGVYDSQASKMKKKPNMMIHSDPSILGYSFLGAGERMILGEMETVEDY